MNLKKLFLVTLISSTLFISCTDDKEEILDLPLGAYDKGVLILNQGGFGNGNASMSYLSDDLTIFQNNIFSIVNPSSILGDTAQDIGFFGDFAYIVLNGSNKIEIVNRYTMQKVATISSGLSNPRYIVFLNGKGYVSNWGAGTNTSDDYIAVINLANNSLLAPIPVAEGPEKMVVYNSKIYVAHQGGFGFGNSVSVVNTNTNSVSSINVGDVPNSLEIVNGTLFVLNGGKPSWSASETNGSLSKINLANDTVVGTVNFSSTTMSHPTNLDIENEQCFFTINANIFRMPTTDTSFPSTPIFNTTGQGVNGVYSFAVKNGKIYVGDAVDYSSNGKVYVYSATGNLLSNKTVGVIPAGFYFN